MTDIETLTKRIEDFKHIKRTGFVCVGRGSSAFELLVNRLIGSHHLHADNSGAFTNRWAGCDKSVDYFIKESFYEANFKDKMPATPTPSTVSYEEAAVTYLKLMGIKVGSTVRVMYSVPSKFQGWKSAWVPSMDDWVLKDHKVTNIVNGDVELDNHWTFPFMVLMPVVKTITIPDSIKISTGYYAKFNDDASIEVGGVTLSYNLLEEIHKSASKAPYPIRINGAYQAKFDVSVSVGCQTVPFTLLDRIYKDATKVKVQL